MIERIKGAVEKTLKGNLSPTKKTMSSRLPSGTLSTRAEQEDKGQSRGNLGFYRMPTAIEAGRETKPRRWTKSDTLRRS